MKSVLVLLFAVITLVVGAVRPVPWQFSFSTVPPSPIVQATPGQQVWMVFVGDIMLARNVGRKMAASGDYAFPFRRAADYLRGFDLAFANLETTISSRGVKVGSIYSFRADPRSVEGLELAGLDVISVANNHIWDYSREAFTDTLNYLRAAGISYVGSGTYDEVHQGVVKEMNGTKIGFLGYTNLLPANRTVTQTATGVGLTNEVTMPADITALKKRADLVIVSFHFGDEYKPLPNAYQERIAHLAVDSGADLVIGHHPHVIQDIEQYKGKWIAYSLGNFIFDQYFSKETMEGMALEVTVENAKVTGVQKRLIQLNADFQPAPAGLLP